MHSSDRRGRAVLPLAAAMLLTVVASSPLAQTVPPPSPIAAFAVATRDYAAMHRRIERQLPPIEINAGAESIGRAVDELTNAIRYARKDAQQGDIFTPEVAPLLRSAIHAGLLDHGLTEEDIRRVERAEGIDASKVMLRVNESFPWLAASAMFPCVIDALPPLPPELQYRIVGNTLVLVDVHASLIVDILPNALVETSVMD
jgi:hypothetical protein